jgi:hypothetical protein
MTDDAEVASDEGPGIPHGEARPYIVRLSRSARQLSPFLSGSAFVLFAFGVISGWGQYTHRSPVRVAHVAGTAAWPAQIAATVVACA